MPLVPEFLAGRTPPDLYHQYISPAFETWAGLLHELLPPHGIVADIACGTGLVSRSAAQHESVKAVMASDVAEPMIAKARAIAGDREDKISYSVASALELPLEDESCDVAFCHQGLQFFPDKPQAMREVKRILKPGGKAALAVWTSASDGNPLFDAFEKIVAGELGQDLIPFGPFAFGNQNAIRELALQAGFEIEDLQTHTRASVLPDVRTFVLFDLAFLGRPAADGTLQPILDFDDPDSDATVEHIIARMEAANCEFVQPNGTILAPMTANILVARA